jgi:hypothetical protein
VGFLSSAVCQLGMFISYMINTFFRVELAFLRSPYSLSQLKRAMGADGALSAAVVAELLYVVSDKVMHGATLHAAFIQ